MQCGTPGHQGLGAWVSSEGIKRMPAEHLYKGNGTTSATSRDLPAGPSAPATSGQPHEDMSLEDIVEARRAFLNHW